MKIGTKSILLAATVLILEDQHAGFRFGDNFTIRNGHHGIAFLVFRIEGFSEFTFRPNLGLHQRAKPSLARVEELLKCFGK